MFFCTSSAHSVCVRCVRCVRSRRPTGKVAIKATIVREGTDLRTIESDTGSLLLLEPLPVELLDLSPHRAKLVVQPIMMMIVVIIIVVVIINVFTKRGTTTSKRERERY